MIDNLTAIWLPIEDQINPKKETGEQNTELKRYYIKIK